MCSVLSTWYYGTGLYVGVAVERGGGRVRTLRMYRHASRSRESEVQYGSDTVRTVVDKKKIGEGEECTETTQRGVCC